MNTVWPAGGVDAGVRALATATRLDAFDTGRVDLSVGRLAADLRAAAPALVPVGESGGWLAVAQVRRSSAVLVSPAGGRRRMRVSEVATLVTSRLDSDGRDAVEHLLDLAGTHPARRTRARVALAAERAGREEVTGCVTVRADPGSRFAVQCRRGGASSAA